MRQMPGQLWRLVAATGETGRDTISNEPEGTLQEPPDKGKARFKEGHWSLTEKLVVNLNLSNRPEQTHMPGDVACFLQPKVPMPIEFADR